MTISAVAIASDLSSAKAGKKIGEDILSQLSGEKPQALLVFSSSAYEYEELLAAIQESCSPDLMVGCSSAGEFTSETRETGAVCAVGIRSDYLKFSASLGQGLRADMANAAKDMAASFQGVHQPDYRYHTAIVLTDALAGYTDDFIQALMVSTKGKYQLVGGGAGDDAKFSETHVFYGTKAYKDAAVALEILSNEPVGIGVKHGWTPASKPMRVTEAEGSRLKSLNGMPTLEAFQNFAEETKQSFDLNDPLPFFLHNVIGIETVTGFKLRVPLAIEEDGSLSCASNIPTGSTIHIMRTSHESAQIAASQAAEIAMAQLNAKEPKVALFFDCVATRLRLGLHFDLELKALSSALNGAEFIGCNTYGQIARIDGQFSGFHNCTAVTCLLP